MGFRLHIKEMKGFGLAGVYYIMQDNKIFLTRGDNRYRVAIITKYY